ncbi:cytidine deaminase [Paenibacillus sp. FSL E2-0178]|uniref:cytidine deaminase n=1 Tax=Paenibacillus sp. FSL E2-0178 TaxID=2921361 RepID=UPI0031590DA7
MKTYELIRDDYELIEMAMKVLEKNFDDGVYNHTVGGAIRCKNGNVYLGVNCDGIHGSCAEYIAIGAAITAGERDFDTIVATHDKAHNYLVPPCGNCRQMLINYCPDIKVILNDEEGNPVKVDVKDLLPLSYKRIVVMD